MHRAARVLSVVILSTALLPPGGATAGTVPRLSALEGLPRLDQPVTLTEAKVALGTVVCRIARMTGASLTAAPGVQDEPVALAVRRMPARELLEQLAGLLGYRWRRRRSPGALSCEIWQEPAARQQEEALRHALRAELDRRFEGQVGRYVGIAHLSQTQIQSILDSAQGGRAEAGATANSAKASQQVSRLWIAQQLSQPIPRALARLLGDLSPQQWAVLHHSGEVTFSTSPQDGELQLPAPVVGLLHASLPSMFRPGMRYVFKGPGEEDRERQSEQRLQALWKKAVGYRVKIWMDTDRYRTGASLYVDLRAAPIGREVPDQPLSLAQIVSTTLDVGVTMSHFPPPDADPGDPPRRGSVTAREPLFRTKKRFVAQVKPRLEPARFGGRAVWSLQDLLPDLARTYGVQFIADSYWDGPLIYQGQLASSAPVDLAALLNRLAEPDMNWTHDGDLVLLRSRTWFLGRQREIPLHLVRRWRAAWERQGALSLDDYGEMAASLSDAQLRTLFYVPDEVGLPTDLPDFVQVYSVRSVLRLYHSLSRAQRAALARGVPLPVAQMRPGQRRLFLAAVTQGHRTKLTPMDLAHWAAGSFTMSVGQPFVRTAARREVSPAQRRMPAAQPAGPGDMAQEHLGRSGTGMLPLHIAQPETSADAPHATAGGGRVVAVGPVRALGASAPVDASAPAAQHRVVPVQLICAYGTQEREAFLFAVPAPAVVPDCIVPGGGVRQCRHGPLRKLPLVDR